MADLINDLQIAGIQRALRAGLSAKRGRVNANEIIVGESLTSRFCKTVKLVGDMWYVATFANTSVATLAYEHEVAETPLLQTATTWEGMLTLLN